MLLRARVLDTKLRSAGQIYARSGPGIWLCGLAARAALGLVEQPLQPGYDVRCRRSLRRIERCAGLAQAAIGFQRDRSLATVALCVRGAGLELQPLPIDRHCMHHLSNRQLPSSEPNSFAHQHNPGAGTAAKPS